MELLPGETNIFEITNSNVWQENQIGQLNTAIWSTIRLQPWYIYVITYTPKVVYTWHKKDKYLIK